MNNLRFSTHALERFAQRGFKSEIVELLYTYGYWESAYDGCFMLTLNRRRLNALLEAKSTPAETKRLIRHQFDKISRKALIVSDSMVITMLNVA